MSKVGIVSVIYLEPEWIKTKMSIQECGVPTTYVNRDGTGSLALAYNSGFERILEDNDPEYIWFVSNPCFNSDILPKLVAAMDETGYDAIHPAFDSDHAPIRPDGSDLIKPVAFLEFTCPIVKTETFRKFRLDEHMPYWGHDLSWGYEVRKAGGIVAVHHGITVKHEYIRNTVNKRPHAVTKQRRRLRKMTNAQTFERLRQLYGEAWREVTDYHR